MHKDLGPFLESTAGLPISVPVSTLVRDLFSIGRRASRGSKDFIGGVESYGDFRTTLYYRLTRLRDIVGADPLNGAARPELHLAIKAERWSGAYESDPIIHWDQGISADRGNCGPPRGSTPPRETITV